MMQTGAPSRLEFSTRPSHLALRGTPPVSGCPRSGIAMRGRKPDLARARRLTGHRPISTPLTPASTDMGTCPPELTGAGQELWTDVVDFLAKNGRANRVYRHPLRLLCPAYEATSGREAGVKTLEATRRRMAEMQLTPASSARGGVTSEPDAKESGRARLLQLVARKQARG